MTLKNTTATQDNAIRFADGLQIDSVIASLIVCISDLDSRLTVANDELNKALDQLHEANNRLQENGLERI